MKVARPRCVLIAETERASVGVLWRFVLHNTHSGHTLAACDGEPGDSRDRQELMAVVRGLESLDQPSRVNLVTRCRSIQHGIEHGLDEWRNAHWRQERLGRSTPLRHADLWCRIDRALEIHQVELCPWRIDAASTKEPSEATTPSRQHSRERSRFDSPAIVVVPSPRSRRVVRFNEPQAVAC